MNKASLELGGDNWAAKDTKLLASTVSDDSGRFYPREFTFARGSNLSATRVNADGYIEKGYENLLVQSNNFGTTWANSGTTETSGQSGYDGTNNAWLLSKSVSDGYVYQYISQSGVQCVSVYAKANAIGGIQIYVNAGTTRYQAFNLTNGTLIGSGNNIDAKIESVGNGWYRCSMALNDTITRVRFYPTTSAGDKTGSSGSIYIQDAMLNQGLAALPYVESGASAAKAGILENEPRIDYSSGTASLLLEPQRTNLVPYSEYIEGLGLTDLTPTPNATTSPEGLQNAYKMLTGTAGNEQISKQIHGTSGNNKTHSVYIKADSGVQWIRLIQVRSGFANSASTWFDIQNGVKGSKTGDGTTSVVDDATKIEDAGNGWYRLTLVCTDSTYNTNFDTRVRTAIADGSLTRVSNGSYFVWGYQMESNASYPTSYMPTYGTSQTRGADFPTTTIITDITDSTQGSVYFEFQSIADENGLALSYFTLNTGTDNNIRFGLTSSGSQIYFRAKKDGSNLFSHTSNINNPTAVNKIAFRWGLNDWKLYLNGSVVYTSTSMATFGSGDLTKLESGINGGAYKFLGDVKQLLVFPTKLTDNELQTLTTI